MPESHPRPIGRALENPAPLFSPEQRRQLPISVLFGGNSSERPGSIKSSITVANLLQQAGYEHVDRVDITDQTVRALAENRPFGVAFMTMHGGAGEDGTLQGLLEMLDIPYTGSGIAASAISADKVLFSNFVRGLGYKTANQIVVSRASELEGLDMTFPKVIKPATQGCSYGVFFVKDRAELLEKAAFSEQFSGRMAIEDYIPGREVSVGLFEDPHTGVPHVLPISEIFLKRPIQDFESKIAGGEALMETVIPAQLEPQLQGAIETICADIFTKLNCKGYVRMDLRIADNGDIYVLENNSSPGMLNMQESDFPKMLIAGGVNPPEFADLMVEAALLNYQERHAKKAPSKKEMVEYLGLQAK